VGETQPAHACSRIAWQHAFSDTAILGNYLEGTSIRLNIIPTKTAHPIQLKTARSIWASKKERASTEMMRCIGEEMARAFL